jgi:hypothetical protein
VQTGGAEACFSEPVQVLFKGGRIVCFVLHLLKEVFPAQTTLDLASLLQALPDSSVQIREVIGIQGSISDMCSIGSRGSTIRR